MNTLDRGQFGESEARFAMGALGWQVFSRDMRLHAQDPDGKRTNEAGIDWVAYDPETDRVKLVDNKAFADPDAVVRSATALVENLAANLEHALEEVRVARGEYADSETQHLFDRIEEKLARAADYIAVNDALPSDVEAVIMNAGGYQESLGIDLRGVGVSMVTVTPDGVREARREDLDLAELNAELERTTQEAADAEAGRLEAAEAAGRDSASWGEGTVEDATAAAPEDEPKADVDTEASEEWRSSVEADRERVEPSEGLEREPEVSEQELPEGPKEEPPAGPEEAHQVPDMTADEILDAVREAREEIESRPEDDEEKEGVADGW
jgi:hypothetical protein